MLILRQYSQSKGLVMHTLSFDRLRMESDEEITKSHLRQIRISNNGFNDCSTVSYTQYGEYILVYQQLDASMQLRAINIMTNQEEPMKELTRYSINFEGSNFSIHSVIFSKNHLDQSDRGPQEDLRRFLDSLVLGVVFSNSADQKDQRARILLMEAKRLTESDYRFINFSKEEANQILVEYPSVKPTNYRDQKYFQNRVRI